MAADPRIYGTDLYLEDGDLISGYSGDMQTISSLENLAQSIKYALMTEQGSLYYDPDYGINLSSIIGTKNTALQRSRLRTEISRVLNAEPRIEKIEQLDVTQSTTNPTEINIYARVKPIESTATVEINLIYPFAVFAVESTTITGEAQISSTQLIVYTQYSIYNVQGVYLSTDINREGTNYYTGGYVEDNKITLGTPLPGAYTDVIIDYETLNITRTNIQVTQIDNERVTTNDGLTLNLEYNIYDLTSAYLVSDTTQTGTDYASGATYVTNVMTLGASAEPNTSFFVDYSTTDKIRRS